MIEHEALPARTGPVRRTAPAEVPIGALERLPKWVICIPLVIQWLWLGLRHGSFTLPSAADPALPAGGLVGERKSDYFAGMGPIASAAVARHASFPVPPVDALAAATAFLDAHALAFPIVAKPEVGWCGFGVRRIDGPAALAEYLARFPVGESVLFQAYVEYDGEAGVFYIRHPDEAHGHVAGLALRYYPRVTGDGVSSVATLVAASPRASRLFRDSLHRVERVLDEVPAAGRVVRLSTVGSLRVGGLYRDGRRLITPALEAAIDAIARDMPHFHFGRFDLRYASEERLRAGEGFRIIEVNGAGSEAIEAFDPDHAAWPALRILMTKQARLFEVAAANRRRGHRPIGLRELARLHVRQQRLIERYPPSN